MDHGKEDCARSRQERSVAWSYPAGLIQVQTHDNERVDAKAVGEGGDFVGKEPADMVAPDDVVNVMPQGQERRQVDETIDVLALHGTDSSLLADSLMLTYITDAEAQEAFVVVG